MRGGLVTSLDDDIGHGRTWACALRCPTPTRLVAAAAIGLGVLVSAAQDEPMPPVKAFPNIGITLLDENVADAAYSADGRWLAYPKRDPLDLYMKIWSGWPDGTHRRCLTCDPPAPAKHCGGVAWHPSGDYIVFSAENDDVRTRKADRLAEPGIGLNTNLWAMTPDGSQAWPLTHDETNDEDPRGAIHPVFSPDGTRLVWAGPVARNEVRNGFEWGEWALFFADFDTRTAMPTLRNIAAVRPGDQHSFYESHDWSPDGRTVLFSGNLVPGQPVSDMDLYEYEVATGAVHRLTSTSDWDENARYSADGRSIYWMSSRGLNVRFRSVIGLDWMQDLKSEYWVMMRDGGSPRRVTWFNESSRPDWEWFRQNVSATQRVVVADSSLNPDATRAALSLTYESRQGQMASVLILLELDRRRPDWQ
jgi:hypothetical protein